MYMCSHAHGANANVVTHLLRYWLMKRMKSNCVNVRVPVPADRTVTLMAVVAQRGRMSDT